MPPKQNPTATGRVLWKSLVGASTKTLTALTVRAQYLFACTMRPETAVLIMACLFERSGSHA